MDPTRSRARMWAAMQDIYTRILAHPFIAGLTDGSLPRDAFAHYVVQDAHYLVDYARALALVGAKAPDQQDLAMFAGHARGAIEVERSLHTSLFHDMGISADEVRHTPVMPTTLAYTSYLLSSSRSWISRASSASATSPSRWVGACHSVAREPCPLTM